MPEAEQLFQLVSTYLVEPVLILGQVFKLERLKEVQVNLVPAKSYSIKTHPLGDLTDLLVTQLVADPHMLQSTLSVFFSTYEDALLALDGNWALT